MVSRHKFLQKNPVDAKLRMMEKLPKRLVNSYTSKLGNEPTSKQVNKLTSLLVSILFVLPVFYVLNSIFVRPAFAANFDTTLQEFQSALAPNQDFNSEQFDFQKVVGVTGSLYTMLAGCRDSDTCPPEIRTGAVQGMGDAIASIYSIPPASGIYYAYDVINRLNPVQPAYAQDAGAGFRMLNAFLPAWRAVRNLVYVLFVIGAIILGFSIMFRTKISPQVVMTIQAALPRLVVGLLLVTFSYAIVGFLIDLTYVLMGAFFWGLQASGPLGDKSAADYFTEYINTDIARTMSRVFERGAGGSWQLVSGIVSANWGITTGVSVALGAIIAVAIALLPVIGTAVGAAASAMAMPLVLAGLGLAVAVIVFLFRILFMLARAYLLLLVHLVLAPLLILWASLSGRGIYEGWLKGVLANLLVFPAVGLVFFLTDVLIRLLSQAGSDAWGPPYVGRQFAFLQGMLALGSIILIPQLPDLINHFLSVREPRLDFTGIGRQLGGTGRGLAERARVITGEKMGGQGGPAPILPKPANR
ncbi:MAG: hypothetical protein Q7S60_03585 [bacterium]|nr:hypothetical protein [bacterium]